MTGTSWYADRDAWHRIDPADTNRSLWDRFAMIGADVDDTRSDIGFDLVAPDYLVLHTPSCDGLLQKMDVTFVIADQELPSPCLDVVMAPDGAGQRWIYQVVDAGT